MATATTPSRVVDVLVVGGGPTGLVCATNLLRRGVKNVLIIDQVFKDDSESVWEGVRVVRFLSQY